MSHVEAYLVIPEAIARAGGNLSWSLDGEAIKRGDGTTFALTEELLIFLEGFALARPLIAFGYLLLTLGVVRGRCGAKPGQSPAIDRLREALQASGRSERNAGAFFGHLLADLPAVPDAPTVWEVWRRAILNAADPVGLATQGLPMPPLPFSPEEFLRALEQRAAPYSREDLETWFRTGSGPERSAGEKLADALQARSMQSLEGLLGDLAERQRLSGALPLIEQLGAALSLPPRKLIDPGLPLGGYSDVTTHGKVDQLLLSQFALDEVEFLRRLAERELLYYRREQPRAEVREELLVILDQGVRTWGSSRLVLLAACFALARLAERRKLIFRIATTSRPSAPWAPEDIPPEELARRLETSDLSPDPGRTLETVLADPPTLPRDVVLLTHPRNLDEPDVIGAAHTVLAGVRLFALSADREGHASLGEFQHGRCVPLRDFRVDLTVRRVLPVKPGEAVSPPRWAGPVDPNPCLFFINPGPGNPTLFAFDEAERHLLMALADGALMLVPLNGRAEILPRALVSGGILRQVQWVHGIAGGFLIAGVSEGHNFVVRYHLDERRAEVWVLGPSEATTGWVYRRQLDCVVQATKRGLRSVDLQTGEYRRWDGLAGRSEDGSRAVAALVAVGQMQRKDCAEWLLTTPERSDMLFEYVHLDATGRVAVPDLDTESHYLCPLQDGAPALRGGQLLHAQLLNEVLALELQLPEAGGRPAGRYLCCYQRTSGVLLLQISLRDKGGQHWVLSPQGRLVAFETGYAQVEVRSTEPGNPRKQVTPRCRTDPDVDLYLGQGWLLLLCSGGRRLFRWNHEHLHTEIARGTAGNLLDYLDRTVHRSGLSPKAAERTDKRPAFLAPDAGRYRQVFLARLIAAVDTIGVVTLFDVTGNIVAQVYARGDKWAIATPGGDRLGDPSLLGGPVTADAAVKIAALLRAAERLAPESYP
jgi:hypothetical protein